MQRRRQRQRQRQRSSLIHHYSIFLCTFPYVYMQIPITPIRRVLVRMDVQYLRLVVNTLQKSRCTQA